MRISIIVAIGESGQIGKDNRLLWNIPSDLKNFKKITSGHSILMGRKTFESIGRPLPKRENIIISSQHDFMPPSCKVVRGIDEGVRYAKEKGEDELFIIGGGRIYRECLKMADRIYLTRVDYNQDADTFFPEIDMNLYTVIKSVSLEDDNWSATFEILDRRT